MPYMGGSAYAMANSLMDGYILPSPVNLKRLTVEELRELCFEVEKLLRDLRGQVPDQADQQALMKRNQKLMKLQSAQNAISSYLQLKIRGRV
ncbi:MAG TPA: hypothetical protein PK747_09570 [Acidobacteriota bacterium]|jgi:hypothetical protein|nr:hypothetical protein [Acidobacteriota bacterium]HNT18582.1 hypothetical protein [Acidobacteriota bacterium]HPA28070.1 hypothetical protein [Acidobacteriota bacterium]HQO20907.1 hypothetical protein [Acidobacteriota bacterium]HQQ47640.1 hypothetical protein [Acidobacteriota bacterium]